MTNGIPHKKRMSGPTSHIRLTARDHAALSYVRRYRFVRERHLRANIFGNRDEYTRRIKHLVEAGYFIHPPAAQHLKDEGIIPIEILALGPQGRRLLVKHGELSTRRQQEKRVRSPYLLHTLYISDFMLKLEEDLKGKAVFTSEEELRTTMEAWKVDVSLNNESRNVGVVPDGLFAIGEGKEKVVYALELDRGTMPVERAGLTSTSYLRKILAYQASLLSGLTRDTFDWKRFRVLTVTSSAERRDHILEVADKVTSGTGGRGLFLAATYDEVVESKSILEMKWHQVKGKDETLL